MPIVFSSGRIHAAEDDAGIAVGNGYAVFAAVIFNVFPFRFAAAEEVSGKSCAVLRPGSTGIEIQLIDRGLRLGGGLGGIGIAAVETFVLVEGYVKSAAARIIKAVDTAAACNGICDPDIAGLTARAVEDDAVIGVGVYCNAVNILVVGVLAYQGSRGTGPLSNLGIGLAVPYIGVDVAPALVVGEVQGHLAG